MAEWPWHVRNNLTPHFHPTLAARPGPIQFNKPRRLLIRASCYQLVTPLSNAAIGHQSQNMKLKREVVDFTFRMQKVTAGAKVHVNLAIANSWQP